MSKRTPINESYLNNSGTVRARGVQPQEDFAEDYTEREFGDETVVVSHPDRSFDERRHDARYDNRFDDQYDDRYSDRHDERRNNRFDDRYEDYYDNRRGKRPVNKKKKSKKRSKVLPIIIIVIAGCVLLFCGYKLYDIMSTYQKANQSYKVIDEAFEEKDTDNKSKWVWNYEKLKEICPDAVGYIHLEGVMSYPIVQADDNDKYLRNMINGEYNIAGSIFEDYRFPEALDSRYCVVYGHNMNDNSMFGPLSEYEDEEYYKKHQEFDIYVEQRHYKYYVFSAFTADVDGIPYNFDPLSDEEFVDLANQLRAECPYKTNAPQITAKDHVITLSTCVDWHNYDYRYVVCLVRGEEIIDD